MSGIDSPRLYGLSSINVDKWSKKKIETPVRIIPIAETDDKDNKKEHRIPFMYDMSVAAAIAAIFFLLFTSPMSNTSQYEEAYIAGIGQSVINNSQEEIVPTDTYTIILASYVSEKNANSFIEDLKSEGFDEAQFVDGKVSRIMYGSYTTEKDALNRLNELKSRNAAFSEGWIMQVK